MRARRQAWIAGWRLGWFVALAFLALGYRVHASARPADEVATPNPAKTSTKTKGSPSDSDAARRRQMAQKMVEVGQLPRLDLAKLKSWALG